MRRDDFDTLPQDVLDFLNYQSVVISKSELTVLEYASDLRLFFKFMSSYKKLVNEDDFDKIDISFIQLDLIKKIRVSDAYAFLNYCKKERSNKPAALSRKATSIRMFYRYLFENEKISENPMEKLKRPKTGKALPKYLTLEDSVKLLESVDGRHKERDYAIFTVFLNCGLRLSELCSLDYNQIKSNNTITVIGKGNKERTIYLNEMCINAINE